MDPARELAEDTSHGASWLSCRAVEHLRERAAAGAEDLGALARALREARPAMPVVATRVDRVMTRAGDPAPAAVERAASEVLAAARDADERAAETAAARLRDASLLTLSRSGTVRETLRRAAPERVVVLESRPGGEGVAVAETLATETDVTLAADAAVGHVLGTGAVDAVLVGADSVRPDGSVVNKVGTRTAATVAAREGVPVVVVCARDKVAPAGVGDPPLEPRAPTELYDGDADLRVENPTFDRTPAELVETVVTEGGPLDAAAVASVADDHAALADWVDDA